MSELAAKLLDVEQEIANDKGALNLFALFRREDLTDRWDLVVSGPWVKHDDATLRYLADAVKRHLTPAEMTTLARIVVLPAAEHPVRTITESYQVEHGRVELSDAENFGLPVKHGYIITSRRVA
jgi:hypothetical protein